MTFNSRTILIVCCKYENYRKVEKILLKKFCHCLKVALENPISHASAKYKMLQSRRIHTVCEKYILQLFQESDVVHQKQDIVRQRTWWRRQDGEKLSIDIHRGTVTRTQYHDGTNLTCYYHYYLFLLNQPTFLSYSRTTKGVIFANY